jgi:ATP-dependent exoDNAse (exonuclease V) beta subunit
MSGETGKNLTKDKAVTEDDICLLLSVYNSLNNLSNALTKMGNVQNKLYEKINTLEQLIHNI